MPDVFKEPADASPEKGLNADVHQHDDESDEQHNQDNAHNDISCIVCCQLIAVELALK